MINEPDKLTPYLKELGQRHCSYEVKKEHYNVVGRALLATLDLGLKERFTPQVKHSWIAFIRTISS